MRKNRNIKMTKVGLNIRKANKKDAQSIAKGFKNAYLPLFKEQNLSQTTINEMYFLNDESHILDRLNNNYFFIAEERKNKEFVGVIGLRKDDSSNVHNRISTFFVLEKYRGKGIGSMLFGRVLIEAKKLGVEKLVVSSSIAGAKIYTHWGFKKVRDIVKNFPNGDKYRNIWMERYLR